LGKIWRGERWKYYISQWHRFSLANSILAQIPTISIRLISAWNFESWIEALRLRKLRVLLGSAEFSDGLKFLESFAFCYHVQRRDEFLEHEDIWEAEEEDRGGAPRVIQVSGLRS